MERTNYNIEAKPSCIFTIKYGPMDTSLGVPFYGNDIYSKTYNSVKKPPPDVCYSRMAYLDLDGRPKFTLPLSEYSELKKFKNKSGKIQSFFKGLYE